ncbi:hypothetical protein LOTGIDRAFT_228867 [Lottia gigantea]|uniref:Uncharacterized protein n=1 Tax=Lottia gigantea TaxID=225164 RepID=V4A477_LOTGI|nr:hypothetical protein LOTGIDRAFT_228867 [Lottia gigantea]ESO91492.1 hypothetical protein LOTGIDRAFT_228867 [Lottia gigantea]
MPCAGRYYWGIGSGISAFVGITVGVCVYLCCRKRQRTANTIQNGPLSTVTYGNNGVQTSQMQPGVNYPIYPGQQNMGYSPYSEKPVGPPEYAADPPPYDSVVNSK